MPSHANQVKTNFLYGSQGHKKRRRSSFWSCQSWKRTSSARDRRPGRETPAQPSEPSLTSDAARESSPPRSARQAHSSSAPPRRHPLGAERDIMEGGGDRPGHWSSPSRHQEYYSPRPLSSAQHREQWPMMQPFRTLVASVRRCPWALVPELGPRGQPAYDDVYYPSVPRSFLHDTAISFVVKDHTRPNLPEFVICCPFEHVDLINQLLAPDGSRRQLSARGTSGQPRGGDQLRSMLIDGTPSIELALHRDADGGTARPMNRPRARSVDPPGDDRPWFGSGGIGNARGRENREARSQDDASTRGVINGEAANRWGQQASTWNEPIGLALTPVNLQGGFLRTGEPEVENPRTREVPLSPGWSPLTLRAPTTSSSSSPLPPGSQQQGRTFGNFLSPRPGHFQATVETAPPSPSTFPLDATQDDLAASVLEEGPGDGGNEDQKEEGGNWEQEGHGGTGEPPALVYLQPCPGQLERGVPLNGWLCDPEWLRDRMRDFTL